MWAHIQEQYLDQYEWFMKAGERRIKLKWPSLDWSSCVSRSTYPHPRAHVPLPGIDDDTYVNRRRLEQDLKLLDSDLPFFLGLKRYGSDTRDLPPPSEIFQQINYLRFCHGGAGYIVSRGLLRMMGDRILECNTSPPSTYLEDVRFAACVYRLTGECSLGDGLVQPLWPVLCFWLTERPDQHCRGRLHGLALAGVWSPGWV